MTNQPAQPANKNNDEIDLLEVFLKIWHYRRFIILFTAVVAIGAIVYSLVQDPQYESSVKLYQKTGEDQSSSRLQGLASQFGMGGAMPSGATYNIKDLVNSRRINRKILYKKWENEKYDKPLNLIEYWEIEGESPEEKFQKALKTIDEKISVNKDEETQLITITVLMPEAQMAADIANHITTLVEEYVQTEEKTSTQQNLQHIEQRLKTVKKELTKAEEDLKRFRERNRAIAGSPQLQMEMGRLQRQVEIKQQVYLTLQKEREMAEIDLVKETPVINVLDEAMVPQQRAKPKRKLIVIVGTFAGFFMSLLIVVLIYVWKYVRREMAQRQSAETSEA